MTHSNTEQLKQYLLEMSLTERKEFAKACLTTLGNLQQIIYVNKKCSAELAIRIDKASNGHISCDLLCPKADFNYLRNQTLTA
jgi:DNA-binding transcriptional regulator YdaS (Cro superfamily)